jgi:RNA polymerase sigma-70 factor (ECF subfamily)
MTLAAAGMLSAFGEIVRRYEGPVRALCAKMLSGGAGDDAAQEVFLEIWRTCARYEGRGDFRAFLFTAVRHRCLKLTRRRGPLVVALEEKETGEAQVTLGAAPDQIETILADERRQQMDRLVSRLPPKLREAICLRFAAELEYREIAAIVDRSEETVRSRVFAGLRRLRDLIGGGRRGHRNDRSWR